MNLKHREKETLLKLCKEKNDIVQVKIIGIPEGVINIQIHLIEDSKALSRGFLITRYPNGEVKNRELHVGYITKVLELLFKDRKEGGLKLLRCDSEICGHKIKTKNTAKFWSIHIDEKVFKIKKDKKNSLISRKLRNQLYDEVSLYLEEIFTTNRNDFNKVSDIIQAADDYLISLSS